MYVNTEDDSSLPVIGFSLKGAIITSDFLSSFAGERGAAGGGGAGRRKEMVSEPGSSDRRVPVGGPEGGTEAETEGW